MSKILKTCQTLFFGSVIAFLIFFCTSYLYWLVAQYPYHISWDMDLTTTIDTLLIHGNLLPAHFIHTAFGIHLITRLTQTIAMHIGSLTAYNLTDLQQSLNPILNVAQVTDFIRMQSPFVAILTIFCLFYSIYLLFFNEKLICLFVFIVFAVDGQFRIQTLTTRSEVYALLFWSLALLLGTISVRTKFFQTKAVLIFFSGMMLGICFTTKVQSIFYVFAMPLLLLLINSSYHYQSLKFPISQANMHSYKQLANFNLILLLAFSISSLFVSTTTVTSFRESYGLTPQLLLLLLICVVPQLVYKFKKIHYDKSPILSLILNNLLIINALRYLNILVCGFLLSFFLALCLYPSFSMGLLHALLMFKITVMGKVGSDVASPTAIRSLVSLRSNLHAFSLLYISLFTVYSGILLGKINGLFKIDNIQLLTAALLILLQIAFLFLGIRIETPRDYLWISLLPTFLLCYLLLTALKTNTNIRFHSIFKTISIAILISLSIYQINKTNIETKISYSYRTNFEQSTTGGNDQPFLKDVYGGNQLKYTAIMDSYYKNKAVADVALWQARYYKVILKELRAILPDQTINLKNISLAYPGMRLDLSEPHTIIQSVPSNIEGFTLLSLNFHKQSLLSSTGLKKLYRLPQPTYLFIKLTNPTDLQLKIQASSVITTTNETGNETNWYGFRISKTNTSLMNELLNNYKDEVFISIQTPQMKESTYFWQSFLAEVK